MAKLGNNVFVVIPAQFDEEEEVAGLNFKTGSAAMQFTEAVNKAILSSYCKVNKITDKEEKKKVQAKLGMDVLLQPLDSEGNPVGEPAIFEQVR